MADPKDRDFYYHKAKKENYAARSVFKLEEIDRRFRLIKHGQKILDLGCAPGSWSQYVSEKVGPKGRVLGIDLSPVKLTLPNTVFITGDMRDADLAAIMTEQGISPPFDVVLSDMAPKTTGIRDQDQARSFELCELALQTARKYLKPKGAFVAKMFHSGDFEIFRKQLRECFAKVDQIRPDSTRKESKEIFLIGLDFKGTQGA